MHQNSLIILSTSSQYRRVPDVARVVPEKNDESLSGLLMLAM